MRKRVLLILLFLLYSIRLFAQEINEEQQSNIIACYLPYPIPFKVNFSSGKYDIRPEDFQELDLAIGSLNAGGYHIEISGHTDNQNSSSFNQTLSEKRAERVHWYFKKGGLDTAKVKVQLAGYGDQYPCDTNTTEKGRFNNNRVVITVLDKKKGVNSFIDEYDSNECIPSAIPPDE